MPKNKLKNISNAEIEVALEKGRTTLRACKLLGVSHQALYLELKKRGKVLGATLRDIIEPTADGLKM